MVSKAAYIRESEGPAEMLSAAEGLSSLSELIQLLNQYRSVDPYELTMTFSLSINTYVVAHYG